MSLDFHLAFVVISESAHCQVAVIASHHHDKVSILHGLSRNWMARDHSIPSRQLWFGDCTCPQFAWKSQVIFDGDYRGWRSSSGHLWSTLGQERQRGYLLVSLRYSLLSRRQSSAPFSFLVPRLRRTEIRYLSWHHASQNFPSFQPVEKDRMVPSTELMIHQPETFGP